MKLIVGLGNPGKKYSRTRHNLGFLVLDKVAEACGVSRTKKKFNSAYAVTSYQRSSVLLVKPLTYMNLSGKAVRQFVEYYTLEISQDVLIVVDDVHLPFGKCRMRQQGSAGGHNGLVSLIDHMGTSRFQRLRVGIDKPLSENGLTNYVLGRFTQEEEETLPKIIDYAARQCLSWLEAETP